MVKYNTIEIYRITKTYDVRTQTQLVNALSDIGSDHGIIYISEDITLTGTITINIVGSVVIQGMGDGIVITTGGDWITFYITGVESAVLKDFKIDASAATSAASYTIRINEVSDNSVIIDNIGFISTSDTYCILSNSNNVIVRNSRFIGTKSGAQFTNCSHCFIYNNYFYLKWSYGTGIIFNASSYMSIKNNVFRCSSPRYTAIGLANSSQHITISENILKDVGNGVTSGAGSASYVTITGNVIEDFSLLGISSEGPYWTIVGNIICNGSASSGGSAYGIKLNNNADYNVISGNLIYNIQNAISNAYGIGILSGCTENTLVGNTALNCKTANISDAGTGTLKSNNNEA